MTRIALWLITFLLMPVTFSHAGQEVYWKGAATLTELTPQCPTQIFEEMGGFTLESKLRPGGLLSNGAASFLTLGKGSRFRRYKFFYPDKLRQPRFSRPAVLYVRAGNIFSVVEERSGGKITPVGFDETTKTLRLVIRLRNVRGIASCNMKVTGTYVKAN